MSPLTGVLAEAWDLYRRFAGHFLLISFVICVVTAILAALLSLGGIAGALVGAVLSFAATYVVQASLIKAVQDVRDGRVNLDLAETVRGGHAYLLPADRRPRRPAVHPHRPGGRPGLAAPALRDGPPSCGLLRPAPGGHRRARLRSVGPGRTGSGALSPAGPHRTRSGESLSPAGSHRAGPGRAPADSSAGPGSRRAITSEPPLIADRSLPRPARAAGDRGSAAG